MSRQTKPGARLVYSTDGGRLCPQCHRSLTDCVCGKDRPATSGDGIVRLRRETKGRGGKAVTIITGIPLAEKALKVLAKQLKQKCGVGGSVKNGDIEIQGDQRTLLKPELDRLGYITKIAGG
ncbi:MAG: translation initiation factor 1 [Alcanivorax sp.]|jgi:translation initiation factor 1